MEKYQYDIFKTQWGWFGVLGGEQGLIRTCLPLACKETVQNSLLSDIHNAEFSKNAFSAIKKSIDEYYRGFPVDFSNLKVQFNGLTDFQQKVLAALRTIKYCNTLSYGELASLSGYPKATRATGTAMARNPLPLIIPCHRVIRADGSIGQFSAVGGEDAKKRMLDLEKKQSV